MGTVKSEHERVEDFFKKQLNNIGVKYYTKTESINSDIDNALKVAPSKSGNIGNNYPDIKVMIETKGMRRIPVMLEVKGQKKEFIKLDKSGNIELVKVVEKDTATKKKGDLDYSSIEKYAVNGAIHYVNAIINNSKAYKEGIAIGLNGWLKEDGTLETEIGVYYVSIDNMMIPKKVGEFTDLTFLSKDNVEEFVEKLKDLMLSEEEIEKRTKEAETKLDEKLRKINQVMQDTLQINVNYRVNLISGMIMAGLGVEGKVAPLDVTELKGSMGKKDNDGCIIMNKIESFLEEKNLPNEKKEMIISLLSNAFISQASLYTPINGESKLKSIYSLIATEIMPIFNSPYHLDFTGKLFNVLNEWVSVPDGDKNDVVLTPRYVTDLMAKLAKVDMNSYVWDYATGSAGFLVSAMKLMLLDAKKRINSPKELKEKELKIKCEQLLGIEKLSDIYMLAVLNMILMGDGSSNILHEDSLVDYNGKYEQGEHKDEDFPANVFLLNPPYSAAGKGFVFAEKALSRMKTGRAVILIQENAGSGQGLPYTANLLKNNTLVASIHMANIFSGKAGVQVAVYVLDIGKPHDEKSIVKFIDMSNDGYLRQNRKKSSQDVNLKDVDHATERYEEVVNLVLYGKQYLHYYTENEYIEDTITLDGKDWCFSQHKKIDTMPTEADFKKVVQDYLAWKVSSIIKDS